MVQKNYNKKILIISSNFYPEITRNLLDGVTQVLDNEKKNYDYINLVSYVLRLSKLSNL